MKPVWLAAAAIILSSHLPQSGNPALEKQMRAVLDRFTRIQASVLKRQLSREDQAYVLQMFAGGLGYQRVSAFMCLEAEVEQGLLTSRSLMSLVEVQLKRFPGLDAANCFLYSTESFCGWRWDPSASFKRNLKLAEQFARNERSLADLEPEYIEVLAASHSEGDRMMAGAILAAKRRLSPQSRAWVLEQVVQQIKRSKGREREAWEVVRRTVLARNPG